MAATVPSSMVGDIVDFEAKLARFLGSMGDQAEGGSRTASLSASVRVSISESHRMMSTADMAKELSAFGDIARLDMSLAAVLGSLMVTYFDVRCAQRLLAALPEQTESYPASPQDFRAVRMCLAAFAEMMGTIGGLNQFGEVANVTTRNDAVIEFYDMRAAQCLLAAAGPSATPVLQVSNDHSQLAEALNMHTASWRQTGTSMSGSATSLLPSMASQPPQPPPLSPLAMAALAAETRQMNVSASQAKGGAAIEKPKAQAQENGSGRPLRTKVSTKDFSKFDIDPERIMAGEDDRTTVMVRNLTGSKARPDFIKFLEQCSLNERYLFFYMPCKEHRNVPAGFAFVNFISPEDVLKLHVMLKRGHWKEVSSDTHTKTPAVSYARFQGQEELMAHFNSSAVLQEQDPERRPLFRTIGGPLQVFNNDGTTTKSKRAAAKQSGPAVVAKAEIAGPLPPPPGLAAGTLDETVMTMPEPVRVPLLTQPDSEDFSMALERGAKEIAALIRGVATKPEGPGKGPPSAGSSGEEGITGVTDELCGA